MARLIPNESTWIGFIKKPTYTVADITVPEVDEITNAIDLTSFVVSLNATSQGNTVPTPNFDSLFETSTPGTVTSQFTADFYRDDATSADTAWDNLSRGTEGFFIVSRYGGSDVDGSGRPAEGDECEVWPVSVTSRTMQNMTSNQVLMFSITCSVPQVPCEAAVVTDSTP